MPLLEAKGGTRILVFCIVHLQTIQESTTDLTKGFGRCAGVSRRPLALQGFAGAELRNDFPWSPMKILGFFYLYNKAGRPWQRLCWNVFGLSVGTTYAV